MGIQDDAKETAGTAAKQAGRAVEDGAEKLKEKAEDLADKAGDRVDELKADAKVKAAEAERDSVRMRNEAKDRMRD